MARIPYADRGTLDDPSLLDSSTPPEELDPAYQHLMEDRARNSYRLLGHRPTILRTYRDLVDRIKSDGGLSLAEQEYAILCCAREIPSPYEWHNHVRIALNAGVPAEEIRAIGARNYGAFEPAHEALLEYVARFIDGRIDDAHHAALADHYDAGTIAAIGVFAGYWLMNARLVDALGIECEEEFVGWALDNV
ncbi:MAG: carboxymuconolactone decarboxylase family protein [Salinirussus sp.]